MGFKMMLPERVIVTVGNSSKYINEFVYEFMAKNGIQSAV